MAANALTERLASGDPAAIHNLFIQLILTPLTTNTGRTANLIDEFGAGLALTSVIGAIIVWRKRNDLTQAPLA
jgi:hypothetical protein